MRMKVSDYIAQKLVDEGITDAFMVTGGGAMHLDDGLGHQPGLHCYFNHHEQACAIAAEAYAVVCICDCMNYILEPEDLTEVFRLVNNYLDSGVDVQATPSTVRRQTRSECLRLS